MEGQWDRVGTPLSGRDRRMLAVVLVLTAIGAAAALAFALTRGPGSSNADCVIVTVASTMGGTTLRNCGAAARRFCLTQGRIDPSAVAQCTRLGYPLPPA
jgi:hypothetical protein